MEEVGVPVQFDATGDISDQFGILLRSLVLTAGAGAAATAVIKNGGAAGTAVLTLAAVQGTSTVVPGPLKIDKPHLTLGGAAAAFSVAL
jgi:hypothetical protein